MKLSRLTILPLLLGDCSGSMAHADTLFGAASANQDAAENSVIPFVSVSKYYNSNLFAMENSQQALKVLGTTQTSDMVTNYSAGANFNWHLGRQDFTGHAIINQADYNTFKQPNNTSHDILLQWNWLLGHIFLGDRGFTNTTQLYNLTYIQAPINDTFTSQTVYFDGYAKLTNEWQLFANTNIASYTNNTAGLDPYSLSLNSVGAGIRYITSQNNEIDLISKYSVGNYPDAASIGGVPLVYNFPQTDNGLKFVWGNNGKSMWFGNLDYTQRITPSNPSFSFSGLTGNLEYKWQVLNKTSLDASIYRNLLAYNAATTSYMMLRGIVVTVTWNPTSKTAFNLYGRSEVMNVPINGGLIL